MNEPLPARPPLPALRPSACPGLLRIVQALDGGICRIKLPGGVLTASQAQAVADNAAHFAGGVIEATNRANLQIRGIAAEHGGLTDALLAAGLGSATVGGDDVRNLMLSPAAGIDPRQYFDTRPLAAQVLATLEGEPRLHGLSAKFAVQLDGGEALAMLDHHHDLWLSPCELDGEFWLTFGLAGCPAQDAALGAVPLAQGHALIVAVLERFLQLATQEQHRMRDVLAAAPVGATLAREGRASAERFIAGLGIAVRPVHWQRPPASQSPLGIYPQRQAGRCYVGVSAPLGRLDPTQLRGAAQLAVTFGDGAVRMTPWQGLVLANIAAVDAPQVQAALQALGLIISPAEPLAAIIACTGARGCAKGLADTKGDARLLATLLQAPAAVHLTGCSRSCAAAHVAPATLLAVGAGFYDLYVRDTDLPGFGQLRATKITLQAAGTLLDACSRSDTHD